jgi:crotonobetainyl-CoA:carnitine CoA-transferase CaiB-like acyl-CoA transferase
MYVVGEMKGMNILMKILSGIKVIDLTEGVAGPYATSILGDMGANVIKIERPEGDWGRSAGKTRTTNPDLNSQFIAINRNKRDLGLNLKSSEGINILYRLLEDADVLVTNYRPGVMKRLNFSYEDCCEINQSITYCTISAFGQDTSFSKLPGSDTVLQSISGMMDLIGEPDRDPLRIAFPLIDMVAANNAVQAILLSLYAKKNGEKGSNIDISLINSALSLMSLPFSEYSIEKRLPQRHGNQNPNLAPAGSYRTSDGKYITIAVLRESHWKKFCIAIDYPNLENDDRYNTNTRRLENREKLNAFLEPIFLSKSSSEWYEKLREADVLIAPLNNFEDVMKDNELKSILSLIDIHLSKESLTVSGNPIMYNEEYFSLEIPPPRKGEHTTEVLLENGFSNAQIESYFKSGVVFGE